MKTVSCVDYYVLYVLYDVNDNSSSKWLSLLARGVSWLCGYLRQTAEAIVARKVVTWSLRDGGTTKRYTGNGSRE